MAFLLFLDRGSLIFVHVTLLLATLFDFDLSIPAFSLNRNLSPAAQQQQHQQQEMVDSGTLTRRGVNSSMQQQQQQHLTAVSSAGPTGMQQDSWGQPQTGYPQQHTVRCV